MAIKELWESRRLHITTEGTTMERVFSCDYTDWNAGNDGTTWLPVIGEAYSARSDLRVTDIDNTWITNNECQPRYLYSTENKSYADKRCGAEIEFHFELELEPIEGFLDKDDTKKTTTNEWVAGGGTDENKPEFKKLTPRITAILKIYSDAWNWSFIKDAVGRVNSNDFLKQWKESIARDGTTYWEDDTGDDTGYWLFASFDAAKVRDDLWELVCSFTHNGKRKWNEQHGVTTLDMYDSFDFNTLFAFVKPIDEEVDDGLRA